MAFMTPPSPKLEKWANHCAMELQCHAPPGVLPFPWALDRARNMAVWVSGDSTVPEVVDCLSKGTLRTGETVGGLPVEWDALQTVAQCVCEMEGE
jgi:hypothetical protein